MKKGITVNGIHSYNSKGLRMLKRSIGSAQKDDHTERLPYSNITYNFDSIFGKSSYDERILTYSFEFLDFDTDRAADRVADIINSMHWQGYKELYDDMMNGYHFEVTEPEVSFSEKHGVYSITMTFHAKPQIFINPEKQKFTPLPDVDMDGLLTPADSSKILEIYSDISTGRTPSATREQLWRADADGDGEITAADASDVLDFVTKLATGEYEGLTLEEAWIKYLNRNSQKEIY